jgi:hypothetical protein
MFHSFDKRNLQDKVYKRSNLVAAKMCQEDRESVQWSLCQLNNYQEALV